MSQADPTPDPDDPRRGMHPRPKRGRALLLGTFLGLIVFVFLFITLVSQCGTDDDAAFGDGPQGGAVVVDAVVVDAVVVGDPAPPSTGV